MSQDCRKCQESFADLLLDPSAASSSLRAHLATCDVCRSEMEALHRTMACMDEWQAPEPSAYFDTRLYAQLRTLQEAPPETLWERAVSYLRFSTGRGLRPALAGALGVALLLGGGTTAALLVRHEGLPAVSSPTVNDLKIYDNNAQAVDQMDLLDDPGDGAPQS